MAGPLHGNIDCLAGSSIPSKETSHTMFKNLYDFLNTLTSSGVVTRIAYNTGSFGSGTGYYDDPNPFGRNAWYCFRFNTSSVRTWDWYMLVQHTSGTGNFGQTPGDPGLTNGAAEAQSSNEGTLAIATATLISTGGANLNPWNGTTLNNGDDVKGDPVWNSGSASDILSVLPRSNNAGGSHDTSKQNMAELWNSTSSTSTTRFHFLSDDDGIAFFIGATSDNTTYGINYVGHYQPRSELTSSNFTPMVMFIRNSSTVDLLDSQENYGTTAGTSTNYEGGIVISGAVRIGRIARYDAGWQVDSTVQPNSAITPAQHDVFSVPVLAYESPNLGQVGYIVSPIYQELYNANSHDTNADLSRAVLGNSSTTATTKIFTAWTGSVAAPGTGAARTGSIF